MSSSLFRTNKTVNVNDEEKTFCSDFQFIVNMLLEVCTTEIRQVACTVDYLLWMDVYQF